jgi:hypothetical protein
LGLTFVRKHTRYENERSVRNPKPKTLELSAEKLYFKSEENTCFSEICSYLKFETDNIFERVTFPWTLNLRLKISKPE